MSTLPFNRFIKIRKYLTISCAWIIPALDIPFVSSPPSDASPLIHQPANTVVLLTSDILNKFSVKDQHLLQQYLAEENANPTIFSNILAAINIYDKYRRAYLVKKYSLIPYTHGYLTKVTLLELDQYLLLIHTKLASNQKQDAYTRICMLLEYVKNQNLLIKYSGIINNKYNNKSSYAYIIKHIHQHPFPISKSLVNAYYFSQEALGIYDVRNHLNHLAIDQLNRTAEIISRNKIPNIPDMQLV